MLRVRLHEAMEDYHRRSGERMTYDRLAALTGLSRATLASLASRASFSTRLVTIAKICVALGCQPWELQVLISKSDHVFEDY